MSDREPDDQPRDRRPARMVGVDHLREEQAEGHDRAVDASIEPDLLGLERLIDQGSGYCLDKDAKLSRRWEVTKFPDASPVDAMAIGWTGGTGAYDCFCAYRAFGPVGETWGTTLVYALAG